MSTKQTFGGAAAFEFRQDAGLVFCRQMADVEGAKRHVLAVWRPGKDGVYAIVLDGPKRTDEDVLGCALTALAVVGRVERPRVRTIERVAGVLAEMMRRPAPATLVQDWAKSPG